MNTIISFPALQHIRNGNILIPAGNDPDYSLLELVMEAYTDIPEPASTPPDDADELLTEEEYLLNRYSFSFRMHSVHKIPGTSAATTTFVKPHLEAVTPPPKQA